jgi:Xaa-Pro aminopeptidase
MGLKKLPFLKMVLSSRNKAVDKMTEFAGKLEQVRRLLDKKGLNGILLTQQKNVTWLTSGRSFVNSASEKAIVNILVTESTNTLIVNNIESARLIEEEFNHPFDSVEIYPWYEPHQMNIVIQKLIGNQKVESDTTLENDLIPLRTRLTSEEKERIECLGKETAEAIEETAFQIQVGESEYQIAAHLAGNCLKRGIEPIVNLVAVDERVYTRRHPLPTHSLLKNYAMLVVCGRRKGQIASATRLVHFGEPYMKLIQLHRAVASIDAALIFNTRPETSFQQLFQVMKESYEEIGFSNEWQHHHQGGLSGYSSREQLLLPQSTQVVKVSQVYAWNPSITGVKSEDTILVGEQENRVVTYTGNYPMIEVSYKGKTIQRPGILIR